MRRLGIIAGIALAFTMALPAAAGGNPGTVSLTQTWHGLSEIVTDVNPCTGDLVTIHLTSNGVMHETFFANSDEYWFTLTDTSDFVFTDGEVTYAGHGTFWVNGNWNERNQNFTLTFDAQGRGSDGSRVSLSEKAHLTLNAVGDVTVSFDVISGRCR